MMVKEITYSLKYIPKSDGLNFIITQYFKAQSVLGVRLLLMYMLPIC